MPRSSLGDYGPNRHGFFVWLHSEQRIMVESFFLYRHSNFLKTHILEQLHSLLFYFTLSYIFDILKFVQMASPASSEITPLGARANHPSLSVNSSFRPSSMQNYKTLLILSHSFATTRQPLLHPPKYLFPYPLLQLWQPHSKRRRRSHCLAKSWQQVGHVSGTDH